MASMSGSPCASSDAPSGSRSDDEVNVEFSESLSNKARVQNTIGGGRAIKSCPPQAQGKHYKLLLQLIRSRQDPKAALDAAMALVEGFPAAELREEGIPSDAPDDPPPMLDQYPRCRQLLNTLRRSPNNHNKTPVAVLHEYATRFHRQVVYTELSKSTVGPFTVEAKLMSITQEHTFATATSQGRAKKDAKQAAAAAILEELLQTMPEMAFLMPGKSTKPRIPYGANPRSRPAASRSGQTLDLLAGQLPHLQAQETLSSALFSTPGLGSQQLASGMPSAQFALPTMASTPMAPPMTLPPATAMSPIRVQQNFDHASFVNHDVAAAPLQGLAGQATAAQLLGMHNLFNGHMSQEQALAALQLLASQSQRPF